MSSQLRVDKIVPVDGAPTGGGGGIVQIIQTVKTDTFSNNTQSFVEITGLNVLITPKFSTSKLLVEWGVYFGANSSLKSGGLRLVRTIGGTANDLIFVGDQDGDNANMVRATNWATHMNTSGNRQNTFMGGKFLDSPNTTSQVKYHMALASGYSGENVFINKPAGPTNSGERATVPSSITVMEVSV